MGKDFPTGGSTAFGDGGDTSAFPAGEGAFRKVVPMVPGSQSNPTVPYLRPIVAPPQGLGES